jgi:cytochrome c peroxidase
VINNVGVQVRGASSVPDRRLWLVLVSLCCVLVSPVRAAVPLGLPADVSSTRDNGPLAEVGKQLFSDKRLSADGSVSCATCHIPERQFTDGRPVARGLAQHALTRHTPSLLNVRYATSLFWDGRASDLATQVRTPLLGPTEHGLLDEQTVANIVRRDAAYATAFARLLGVRKDALSIRDVGTALAAYETTLLAGDSAFDRYLYGHDAKAMTPAAVRGLALFRGRAQCESCHRIGESSALLSDGSFHSSPLPLPDSTLSQLGALTAKVAALRARGETDALNALVASDRDVAALGRFVVTLDPKDIGCFKTPSLRNVALSGPYMHNGSISSLSQAIEIELYSRAVQSYPLVLTEDERSDLLQFLAALSSPSP